MSAEAAPTVTVSAPHPLNSQINTMVERIVKFQASRYGGRYLNHAPPHPLRAALFIYLAELQDKKVTAESYLLSSLEEVIKVVTSENEHEAMLDTRNVCATWNDFNILTRSRLHMTSEQVNLIVAIVGICNRSSEEASSTIH